MAMRPLVISVHGIRTRGAWQKELTSELNRSGFDHHPLDFGFFRAIRLLWPRSRDKQIEWFRDQYTAITLRNPERVISVIAHSFGTYLVARSLERYSEITFDRIVFCGSIVRQNYSWTNVIHSTKQVQEVLNDYGRLDVWAGLVGWVASDTGPSGTKPFYDDAAGKVTQREHPEFRHSDYFYVLNYQKNWIPFLNGTKPVSLPKIGRRPTNWRYVATMSLVSVLTLAAIVLVISGFNFRRPSPKVLEPVLTINGFFLGGWDISISNPTDTTMSISRGLLTSPFGAFSLNRSVDDLGAKRVTRLGISAFDNSSLGHFNLDGAKQYLMYKDFNTPCTIQIVTVDVE